jgi:RNA polymerase sigma-70 factor, ECF subfamily
LSPNSPPVHPRLRRTATVDPAVDETATVAPVDRCPPAAEAAASPDESAVVRAAMAGDRRAFDQLVHSYHRRVFNFLYHMTRQREDAEDLTQQTFLKAYRHLDRVDPLRPLTNWLLTIARHNALNHFRSARKWEYVPDEIASAEPSPARQAETRDSADDLWARARRLLGRREFEALWLRFAEDLSTAETARVMGLTQIHIKVLVHRARQRLLKGESPA